MDLFAAGILLILLLPVFLFMAVIIMLDSKGPVFFVQDRAGYKGKAFKIFKFRTMYTGSHPEKGVDIGDSRITKSGHLLREWSLDELPQLINVVKGEMSLVGPRPLLTDYVERYTTRQRKRLDMKPGITGLQQAMCRYDTTWNKKFAYDLCYITNFNLCLDVWILLKTINVVLFRPAGATDGGKTYVFVNKKEQSQTHSRQSK